jgi:PAS domain S-box-containing protein
LKAAGSIHGIVRYRLSSATERAVGLFIAVGVAYFLATWLGVALRPQVALCIYCPAAGVAVGALILFGPNARMPIATSVAITTVASGIMFGKGPWEAAAFGFINPGQALLTTWLIERWFGDDLKLMAVPQVLGFLVASAIGVAIGATGASIAKTLAEPIAFHYAWQVCFGACLLGTLTIAPLLIGLGELPRELPPRRELFEGTIAIVILTLLSVLLILLPQEPWDSALPVAFVLPVLLWLAVRCRLVFSAAAASVLAVTIFWSTASHTGHFGDVSIPLANRILAAQTYATAGTLLSLILSALFAERRRTEETLKRSNDRLQLAIDGGKMGTFGADLRTGQFECDVRTAVIHGYITPPTTIKESRRFVLRDDLVWIDNAMRQASRAGGTWNAEYRVLHPLGHLYAGEMRWVALDASIVRDQQGTPVGLLGVTRDITDRKRAEERQHTLNAELDHRVKNVLATVNTIAARTMDASSSIHHFVASLDGRIRSMARTHELLSATQWQGISVLDLVRRELAPYATKDNTEIDGPDVVLKAEVGQALGMVLHELATNAAKHGALSTQNGCVSIRWHQRLNGNPRPNLVLDWREVGGPSVVAPSNSGFGMSTIRDLIPYEFGGAVDLAFAPAGFQCRLELPAIWLGSRNS